MYLRVLGELVVKMLYNLVSLGYELGTFSVSRKQIVLEIGGRSKISWDLKRHLSPRTVGTIIRSLPLEGHAHYLGQNIVYLETAVDSGIERARTEFKKGDVAFLPSTGSVCFFTGDVASAKRMTPIGRLNDNTDALRDVRSGDVLRVYDAAI